MQLSASYNTFWNLPTWTFRHSVDLAIGTRPSTKPNLRLSSPSKQLSLKVALGASTGGVRPPTKPNLCYFHLSKRIGLERHSKHPLAVACRQPNPTWKNFPKLIFVSYRSSDALCASLDGRIPSKLFFVSKEGRSYFSASLSLKRGTRHDRGRQDTVKNIFAWNEAKIIF